MRLVGPVSFDQDRVVLATVAVEQWADDQIVELVHLVQTRIGEFGDSVEIDREPTLVVISVGPTVLAPGRRAEFIGWCAHVLSRAERALGREIELQITDLKPL